MTKVDTNYLRSFYGAANRRGVSTAAEVALNAAERYESSGDAKSAGFWRGKLGLALYWQGEYQQAMMAAEQAIQIQPDLRERGRSMAFLAAMYCVADRAVDSLETIKHAREICSLFPNDEELQGVLCHNIAFINEVLGDIDRAVLSFHGLLYSNESMHSVVVKLKSIARTSETVLVLGETGTGKELVAQAIHAESPRRNAQFIAFNCTTLSRDTIESRLFGHRKGAFTGADHIGIIRAAERGTLLLDEIGDLSLEAQGALLRFLQSHEIQPVGDTKPIKVDTRVIAATNRDLKKDVEAGHFRADLYHRLSVVALLLPPLWQRRDDIPVLARHFARSVSQQYGMPEPVLDSGEMTRLTDYDWPGNVRELENYMRRQVLFGETEIQPAEFAAHAAAARTLMFSRMESAGILTGALGETIASHDGPTWQAREWVLPRDEWEGNAAHDIPPSGGTTGAQSWRSLGEFERRRRLWEVLERTWNVTRAAELLGISRRAIQKHRPRTKIHEV